tara:strand:- start:307 stop:510 length:204 start_codon:yes stop_codon:yes gene_type:complete
MKTYEIRTSKIIYDFYEVKANNLEDAEKLALSKDQKINTLKTVQTLDYCRQKKANNEKKSKKAFLRD